MKKFRREWLAPVGENPDFKLQWGKDFEWQPYPKEDDFIVELLKFQNYPDYYVGQVYNMVDRVARLSPCSRAKIGCYLMVNNRNFPPIYTIGKNDYPFEKEGLNCCKSIGCQPETTCRLTIHAEIDALNSMSRDHDKDGYILFCSAAPCLDCLKQLILRNVKIVIYKDARPQPEYDRATMAYLTQNSGIKFYRYSETGF